MTHPSIQPDSRTMIPDLLRATPQARPVLDRNGLRGCGGALGPHESLEFFARAHDVPLDQLLRETHEAVESGDTQQSSQSAFSETLADSIYRPFFRAGIAGASGILELTGLALWGGHLWRLMSPGVVTVNDRAVVGTAWDPGATNPGGAPGWRRAGSVPFAAGHVRHVWFHSIVQSPAAEQVGPASDHRHSLPHDGC